MSATLFSIGLDTSKLDEGLKQANQSFAEFAAKAEQSGSVIDQGFQKMTVSLKAEIEKQKLIIVELQQKLAELPKTAEASGTDAEFQRMTASLKQEIDQQKQIIQDLQNKLAELPKTTEQSSIDIVNSIKKTTQVTKEEYGKQKQLVVELKNYLENLKESYIKTGGTDKLDEINRTKSRLKDAQSSLLDMQKQSVDGNLKEEASQGSLIGSIGKWALGLATVSAALEIGKKIIASTKDGADQFAFAVEGATAGLGYFFKSIATGDWSNFFDNMTKAIKVGYEYAKMMDDVKESGWALSMMESGNLKRKAELEIMLRDQNLSPTDRKKFGDERMKIEEDETAKRIANAQKELDAYLLLATDRSKIDKDTLIGILKQTDETTRAKAVMYNEALSFSESRRTNKTSEEYGKYMPILKDVKEEVKIYADAMRGVGTIKEETIIGVVNAVNKLNKANASVEEGTKKIQTTINTVEKKIKDDAIAAAKKAKEDAELDNRIKATSEAMKTASGAELKGLSDKLFLLEKEKTVRENIVKFAIATAEIAAAGTDISISPLNAKFTKLALPDQKKQGLMGGIDYAAKGKEYEKKRAEELASYFYDAADAASYLAQQIGDSNKELSGMLQTVVNIGGQLGKLAESGFKMSKIEGMSMAISGATQLVGMVIGQAAENKRVMADFYASIISQQQEYNLLLNDQIRLNSDIHKSVFLRDYEGTLNDSTKAYNDAQSKYQDEYKKFLSSEAIVGKKNVVSGGNVLSGLTAGAALGFGIGTVVPVIGNVVGAVIGGAVGLLTGLFAKKKKDIVAPLLDTYPDLIQANGDFNSDLAKTLITNNKVTEATKKTLQNMIEWKDAADKATEQLKSVISDLTGSLGDGLRTALVTAFTDGTDAALAFKGEVNKVLENIMSNMIFNKAFEGAFKTLEDSMAASYAVGGDQSWLDDFQSFYKKSPELMAQFNKGMADAKKAAGDAGFDVFKSKDINNPALTGKAISAQITEATGSELLGLFRRNADDTVKVRDYSRMAVDNLINIEKNTFNTVTEVQNAVIELKIISKNAQQQYVRGI